ncbi:MAG: DUF362 domain-containing protein, partial [Thermodesulfovibrionales bacterium]|nr:DUF362 domain-containing protein [Thermodesulfovibrionales bacterium]
MKTKVSIVKTDDRAEGVARSIDLLGGGEGAKGRQVLIKPNFNTADPYPGSTHNDTLSALIEIFRETGAAGITVGDRSGPASTAGTLEDKGIYALCERQGAGLINFETMPDDRWERFQPGGSHWINGFYFAKPVIESDYVVSTCCLKTHGFGGGFTISLKNTIGMLHQKHMAELHASFLSMKKMIAEANVPYSPALVVVDALEAMVDKGPMKGPTKHAGLFIAGSDRIAVDAVGVAVLKMLGSNPNIMQKGIFEQEQIA